jgi:hypothetical protein
MVIAMDPDFAAEIAELSRQHDQLMARDREPIGAAPVRKEGPAGLLYREYEETPLASAPEAARAVMDAEASKAWNEWIDGRLATERGELFDIIARQMAEFVSEYLHGKLVERDRKIASAQAELVEVRGLLTSALTALDEVRRTAEGIERAREIERRECQARDQVIRERSARIADLQAHNSASAAELARQQRDRELANRDHRIEMLETRLDMLLRHLSLTGLDLRGM